MSYGRSWGSSVSIVTGYRLDDRGSMLGRGKGFSCSLCVQISTKTTQPPVQWVPGGFFLAGKAQPGRQADHSSHLVSRSRMSRSYTSSYPWCLHGGSGKDFALFYVLYGNRKFVAMFTRASSPDSRLQSGFLTKIVCVWNQMVSRVAQLV
jgi:hypothetical protein